MTEHSEIVIDEFVYDPDPTKSKLALNFASGTARFITGALGTIDKENIKITTPTAEIAIRGTDFTATVDEMGRTLIILLPDEFGDSSGEIVVSSMMGQVVLNKPYQATTVSLFEKEPTSPKILDITLGFIDNMLIVSPPKEEISEEETVSRRENMLDFNDLDIELLENELDKNEESLEFTQLDIDLLDVDFLRDLLDVLEDIDKEEEEEDKKEDKTSENLFHSQWYWYAMVRMLAKEDITRYNEIYMLKMATVLPEMSYIAQRDKIENAERRRQAALNKL